MTRKPRHDGYFKHCEIETSQLEDSQKDLAWAIRDVMYETCDSECWPGNCPCASRSADVASKYKVSPS